MNAARIMSANRRRIAADLSQAFKHRGAEGFFDRHAFGKPHAARRHGAGIRIIMHRTIGTDNCDARFFHVRIIPYTRRTGNPALAIAVLASAILTSPKWKMEAASTALA